MKKLLLLSICLILVGAGCFGGKAPGSATADGGVYKTLNAGDDWGQITVVPTSAGMGTIAKENVLNIEIDPQDSSYLYIGTRKNGFLYSDNKGASWTQPRLADLREGTIYDIQVAPKDVCTVYVAKGARLYKTTDCMRTFDNETYVETRAGIEVEQIAADWYDTSVLWIGLSNGDVLRSKDEGKTWKTVYKSGGEISDMIISNKDSRIVMVSTYSRGMHKTTDGGDNWEDLSERVVEFDGSNEVYGFVQDKKGEEIFATSTYGILRTKDFGESWEKIDLVTSPGEVLIRAIGIDENNPKTIYYATTSTFYRSLDGGESWETERFPSGRVPRALVVDPDDSSMLYIGVAASLQ